MPWGLALVIAIPTAFALLGGVLGEMGLDLLIPTIWQIFVVSNILVLTYSEVLFCIGYISLGLIVAYSMGFFKYPMLQLKTALWGDIGNDTYWKRC